MSAINRIKQKVCSLEALRERRASWGNGAERVVFTNGVFDILHKGHVSLLARAADFGTKLIVAVNADSSVRQLGKGSNRPVNAEQDRALLLAALEVVDAVVIFAEATPLELILTLQPDVLVKGGDYDPNQRDPKAKDYMVGAEFQQQRGAEALALSLVEGYSTTGILEKSQRDGQN